MQAERRLLGLLLGAITLMVGIVLIGVVLHPENAEGSATLEIRQRGRRLRFGPFVGYRFVPRDAAGQLVDFTCRNTDQFYTRDLPDGALLYKGQARRVELPPKGDLPTGTQRITPLTQAEAPSAWLATRPEPVEEWRHFHSCHADGQAQRIGYWLRHVATASFIYDMGGRVGPKSVLHHRVEPGVDTGFATLLEFDRGRE